VKKRPRVEDDEGSSDEFLLAEMAKKYKKMENEIKEMEKETKEKQENWQALGKTIQMLKDSLRNS
jgi:septal ring factor EnvC (AmiA/AmiB activator)